MRSATALTIVTALVAAPFGMPPEPTPSRIVLSRWGEFDLQRSLTVDPLSMLLALTERTSPH